MIFDPYEMAHKFFLVWEKRWGRPPGPATRVFIYVILYWMYGEVNHLQQPKTIYRSIYVHRHRWKKSEEFQDGGGI